MVPFGRKARVSSSQACRAKFSLVERALQPVARHEIIPVDKRHR